MHKHTIDLLEKMLNASEAGRISWAEVPGKTAFSYLAGEFVVLVDDGAERTSFRLTDSKGRSLEQAGTDDLAAVNLGTGATGLSAVQSIHAIAKRQTMGTDQAIASVMEHLQGLGAEAPAAVVEDVPEVPVDEVAVVEEIAPEPEPDMLEENFQTEEGLQAAIEDVHEAYEEPPVVEEQLPPVKEKKRKRSLLNPFGGKNKKRS